MMKYVSFLDFFWELEHLGVFEPNTWMESFMSMGDYFNLGSNLKFGVKIILKPVGFSRRMGQMTS